MLTKFVLAIKKVLAEGVLLNSELMRGIQIPLKAGHYRPSSETLLPQGVGDTLVFSYIRRLGPF